MGFIKKASKKYVHIKSIGL